MKIMQYSYHHFAQVKLGKKRNFWKIFLQIIGLIQNFEFSATRMTATQEVSSILTYTLENCFFVAMEAGDGSLPP
ncbi:MAG: hypothetical protein R6V02_09930 [Candidatus Aminicenantes bacterium]